MHSRHGSSIFPRPGVPSFFTIRETLDILEEPYVQLRLLTGLTHALLSEDI